MTRTVPEIRWDKKRVQNVAGTPFSMNETVHDEIGDTDSPHRGPDGHRDDGPDADDPASAVQKRLPIVLCDLHKCFFTDGCMKYQYYKQGRNIQARNDEHSEACRARIYECMRRDSDPRIVRADATGDERTKARASTKENKHEQNKSADASNAPSVLDSAPNIQLPDDDWDQINGDEPLPPIPEAGIGDEDYSLLYDGEDGAVVDPEDAENLFGPESPAPDMDLDDHGSADAKMGTDDADSVNAMCETTSSIADVLQTLGADADTATRFACSVRRIPSKPACVEAFGTGNIMKLASTDARNSNIEGIAALDLRTYKPHGQAWNSKQRSDRKLAYRLINEQKPDWVIGSPPCTACCTWNAGTKNFDVIRLSYRHLSMKDVHTCDPCSPCIIYSCARSVFPTRTSGICNFVERTGDAKIAEA